MKKSMIVAFSAVFVCVLALGCLSVFGVEQVDTEFPAIMISKETGEIERTTLKIDGQWSGSIFDQKKSRFSGQFRIGALDHAMNDDWGGEAEFATVSGMQCMQGFFDYKSDSGNLEAAVVYVDTDRSAYVFYDNSYIVFAPADNENDAYMICKEMGLSYPE